MTGQLTLTPEQIADQMELPEVEQLCIFNAHRLYILGKIMMPGGISSSFRHKP